MNGITPSPFCPAIIGIIHLCTKRGYVVKENVLRINSKELLIKQNNPKVLDRTNSKVLDISFIYYVYII